MKKFLRTACLFAVTTIAIVSMSTPNAENESDIEATYAGTIYYVSAAGNDTTGTPDDPTKPYRSPLGAGAGAYSDIPADITRGMGDHIIQFMDGSTYGQINMTPRTTDATHRIILRAAAGMRPTMDANSTADGSLGRGGSNNPILRILPNYVVVQGLHFKNTNVEVLSPEWRMEVMVRLEGSNCVVDGCFFDGNGRTPTEDDQFFLICNTATNNVISGNRFDYSGGKSQLHITATCGRDTPGAQTIRNNVFSRFGQPPAHPGNSGAINFGGAIGTYAGNNSIVENNTFWNNGGAAFGILNTNTSTVTVRNNIFAAITGDTRGYAVGHSLTGESSGTVYNSVMFGNTRNTSLDSGWTLSTYYVADPFFVDTGATPPDLHLQSLKGSRRNNTSAWTIDANCSIAIDNALASSTFELEPSPNGGRRNIGAYGNTPEASKSCIPNCKEENTGDYCFQNNTKLDLKVILMSNPSKISNRAAALTCILQPGQKQCFLDIPAGAAKYSIKTLRGYGSKVPYKEYNAEGSLFVDACQEKIFNIK